MSVYITDKDGKLVKVSGSNTNFTLPIGSIFSSAIPIEDANVHLLDGSLISQTGLYKTFADLIKSLVADGKLTTYTQSQFDSDVSTYGQCGKFVIDNDAGTIRLPKITEFIASSNGGKEIGIAELDMFKSHSHDLYVRPAQYSGDWTSGHYSGGYVPKQSSGNYFDGSGTTATGDSETKPKNIRYPYYIVLAAGYKPSQIVEMDNIVSDVNLKQDKLIANPVALNTTRTGQNDTVVDYYMSSDGNIWYRKWASGWIEQGGNIVGVDGWFTLTFPKTFSNSNYIIMKTLNWNQDLNEVIVRNFFGFHDRTITSARTRCYTTPSGYNESWYACGF